MSFPGGITLLECTLAPSTVAAQAVAFSASVGKLVLTPTRPIAVMRWGFIVTTAIVNSGTVATFTLDWYPTAGTATSAVIGATTVTSGASQWNASTQGAFATDLAGGSITTAANATLAIGKGFYHLIQPQTKMPPNDASTNPVPSPDTAFVPGGGMQSNGLTVYPGQAVAFSVTVAAGTTAGAGVPFIHYIPLAFDGTGSGYGAINNAALASGIPASITPVVGDPGIWTRAIS